MKKINEKNYYTTVEIALALSVSKVTVIRWANEGQVPCIRSDKGWRLYPVESADEFIKTRKSQPSSFSDMTIRTVIDGRIYLSVGDVANLFNWNRDTVRRKFDKGELPGFRDPRNNRRLLPRVEIMKIHKQEKI